MAKWFSLSSLSQKGESSEPSQHPNASSFNYFFQLALHSLHVTLCILPASLSLPALVSLITSKKVPVVCKIQQLRIKSADRRQKREIFCRVIFYETLILKHVAHFI